jgi:hypothetical protein
MHLGSDELIDLAERTRPESDAPHLRSCERCRAKVDELRRAMAAAAEVEVPEPSPLFWPHLSARVRDAISTEGPTSETGRRVLVGWRMWTVGLAALAACFVAAFITARVFTPARGPAASYPAESTIQADASSPDDDPALNLVADLASTLTYEEASELEVSTHAGSVDEAVSGLSADERQELHRLLNDALRRPGD